MDQKTLLVLGGGALLLWLAVDTNKANAATPTGGGGGATVEGLAIQLANNINAKGYDYSRALCKQFQVAAGLTGKDADGIYGPKTQAALSKYTTAPKNLFKGAAAPRLAS